MKRIIALLICFLMVFSLCSCGVKCDRENYKKGLKDYVTLPELKDVKFDGKIEEVEPDYSNVIFVSENDTTPSFKVEFGGAENEEEVIETTEEVGNNETNVENNNPKFNRNKKKKFKKHFKKNNKNNA